MTVYRRPYPRRPHGAKAPPPFDGNVPPLARHPLPDGGDAAGAIARFIGQVLVTSTITVFAARFVGVLWPVTARALFGATAAVLLITAVFKWLWKGRSSGVPWMYAATCVLGVIWILSMIINAQTLLALMGVVFVAYLVATLAQVAHAADGITARLDSGTSFALAGAAVLLLGVAALPLSFEVTRVLLAVAWCVNTVFALLVALTYVGFVLARPGQPLSVIDTASAQWQRILWCKGPNFCNPYVMCGITCVSSVLIVAFATVGPDEPAQQAKALAQWAAPGEGNEAHWRVILNWVAGTIAALLVVPQAVWVCRNRRLVGRLITVWVMYDGRPTPGVYRPHPWIGSARRRQLVLAAVLFVNVVTMRSACVVTDALLVLRPGEVSRMASGATEPEHGTAAIVILTYFASFVIPVLLPLWLFCNLYRQEVRAMHDLVEEASTPDLYPPSRETHRD